MSLLDCDDVTLHDRMERSPELVVPEVRRLQAEVHALRRSAASWESATLAGILAAGLDKATARRARGRIRELILAEPGIWDDGAVIDERPGVLTVRATVSDYVIEPIRFTLGLSRVEMVDDHLATLVKDQRAYGVDADTLLEARSVFAATEREESP